MALRLLWVLLLLALVASPSSRRSLPSYFLPFVATSTAVLRRPSGGVVRSSSERAIADWLFRRRIRYAH